MGGKGLNRLSCVPQFTLSLLFQFFGCLFLIFAAEAVAGILGFLYRDKVGCGVIPTL